MYRLCEGRDEFTLLKTNVTWVEIYCYRSEVDTFVGKKTNFFSWPLGSSPGRKWSKNWGEREETKLELDRILGRSVPVQVTPKKSDTEFESDK